MNISAFSASASILPEEYQNLLRMNEEGGFTILAEEQFDFILQEGCLPEPVQFFIVKGSKFLQVQDSTHYSMVYMVPVEGDFDQIKEAMGFIWKSVTEEDGFVGAWILSMVRMKKVDMTTREVVVKVEDALLQVRKTRNRQMLCWQEVVVHDDTIRPAPGKDRVVEEVNSLHGGMLGL